MLSKSNVIKSAVLGLSAGAMMMGAGATFAVGNGNGNGNGTSYSFSGTCAFLPAGRATEFHGNPDASNLNLGMAGNQWVVFDKTIQAFNASKGGDGTEPDHRPNGAGGHTRADLDDDQNRYFIELIPPGQIRKQIKTGCMTLGNDEERNFLPGNLTVDFDVFASTNYDLMQDLANNGFIDEAVPYIRNRLDLMVAASNPKGIGNTVYTGDTDFDTQFDIIMDLMSGDVIASSLDHINEGIHNASNGYMKKVHGYIKQNDQNVTIASYKDAAGGLHSGTKLATEWVQIALAPVVTPMAGSPSALRLVSRDSGEKHTPANGNHDMATFEDNKGPGACWKGPNGGAPHFCEIAVLNKANTHESRVHHVETPNGVVISVPTDGYQPVDVGYVWITELAFQINAGNTAVTGMSGTVLADLGIPNTAGVNADKIYSLAVVATSNNTDNANAFINFVREYNGAGQQSYVAGGFTPLSQADLDAGKCYAAPVGGVSVATARTPATPCNDWLNNGQF